MNKNISLIALATTLTLCLSDGCASVAASPLFNLQSSLDLSFLHPQANNGNNNDGKSESKASAYSYNKASSSSSGSAYKKESSTGTPSTPSKSDSTAAASNNKKEASNSTVATPSDKKETSNFTATASNDKKAPSSAQSKGTKSNEPPVVFWLKPLNSLGPCAHIINGKVDTDVQKRNTHCAMDDVEGKFELRQEDKTVWNNGKQLVAENGEIRTTKPEYRNQNNSTQTEKAKNQKFEFVMRPCSENKLCLAVDGEQATTRWEVVTEKWRVIDPINKKYAEADAKYAADQAAKKPAEITDKSKPGASATPK